MRNLVRKIIVFFMAVSVIGVFAGCGRSSGNEGKETDITGDGTTENFRETRAGNLKMLIDDDGEIDFDDKNGRYYFFENKGGVGIEYPCIKFVDYEACKEVYLCNQLNCLHRDYDCTAVIPKEYRQGMDDIEMFGDEEYLYLFMQMSYSDGGMSVVEYVAPEAESLLTPESQKPALPPTIYRMKKDGTNREKVFEFASGVSVEPTVLSDGKYLYVVLMKTKDEVDGDTIYSSSYDRQLVRVDLEKKTTEKILDMNNWQEIVGCDDRNIIFSEKQLGREISEKFKYTNAEEYEKLTGQSKQVYCLFDLDKRKMTTFKKIQNSKDYSTLICNGYFYVTYEDEKGMEKINLKNKKSQKIKMEKALMLSSLSGETISVEGRADMLKCWHRGDVYYVNSKTGKYAKNTLTNKYKEPIEIVSQNDTQVFVRYDCKKDRNGEILEYDYGMISKEDFLNNIPNYKKVDMIYSGIVY